jgi:hypothetical protein
MHPNLLCSDCVVDIVFLNICLSPIILRAAPVSLEVDPE